MPWLSSLTAQDAVMSNLSWFWYFIVVNRFACCCVSVWTSVQCCLAWLPRDISHIEETCRSPFYARFVYVAYFFAPLVTASSGLCFPCTIYTSAFHRSSGTSTCGFDRTVLLLALNVYCGSEIFTAIWHENHEPLRVMNLVLCLVTETWFQDLFN